MLKKELEEEVDNKWEEENPPEEETPGEGEGETPTDPEIPGEGGVTPANPGD